MSPSELEELARRQLADYDAHRPGTAFEDEGLELTVAEAYRVQRQVVLWRVARGEEVAGYKIGCLSEAVQRQLDIGHPIFGHVFATEIHASGVTLNAGRFDALAIEGEFAIRISRDIPDSEMLRNLGEACIAACFPVLELHNKVTRGPHTSAAELIANNAIHAGVVLPTDEGSLTDAGALLRETIEVRRNGEALGSATGATIPGGPLASFERVLDHVAEQGGLKHGQIVLTGSPLPLYAAAPGDQFEVCCPSFGALRFKVAE